MNKNHSNNINLALVGAGNWGANLVRNFHSLGALKVICDSNPQITDDLKKKYPEIRVIPAIDEILNDKSIQGIIVASPAATHYEIVKKCLDSGKDIFVEKPLALNVAEGAEIVSLAQKKQKIIFVGHILHYHPAVVKMKEMIRGGIIGRIEYIYSNRLSLGKIRREENILWSFAPHDISLILNIAGEEPVHIDCTGSNFLHPDIADVTMSNFKFSSGTGAHIFVSWLNPFKEQRLVIVGSQGMLVFEDTKPPEQKLILYPHIINWKNGIPVPEKAGAVTMEIQDIHEEPLNLECRAFIKSIQSRIPPLTSGEEGLKVLKVLDACQNKLGKKQYLQNAKSFIFNKPYFVHESAVVDEGAQIGEGTKIWHFSHIMKGAKIGKSCVFGQNVNVDGNTVIGNNVKVQNNVSIYSGIHIEDDVFLGPSCVLTNITNPRSQINRHSLYEKTVIRKGASIGANSTIVCGVEIGRYAFVGAGAVVTKNVPDYGLVTGNPARFSGWMSRHGHRLSAPDTKGIMTCPESGYRYRENPEGVLNCLDISEEDSLPEEFSKGKSSYSTFKKK